MEKDRRISKRKTRISIVLAAVSVVLAVSGRIAPGFAQWYGTHLYPLSVGSDGRILGYFPLSVSGGVIYVLVFALFIPFRSTRRTSTDKSYPENLDDIFLSGKCRACASGNVA